MKYKALILIIFVATLSSIASMKLWDNTDPNKSDLHPQTITFESSNSKNNSNPKEKTSDNTPSSSPPKTNSQENKPVNSNPKSIRTDNAPKQTEIRESVAKEYIYRPQLTSNDPGYSDSWALQKVNAPAAWDITTGSGQTIVAVIDTGFFLEHEDLADQWITNTGESGQTQPNGSCWTGTPQDKRTNNCDDDSNGYLDDWRGWNFNLGDGDVTPGRSNPEGGGVSHGTSVAGLVGASGDNSTGVATINWNTKIMPLQALSDDGPGYTSDIVAAIYYAVDNGADVINMSLGGEAFDPALKAAVDYAYTNNVVTIAAAGNSGGELNCPATNPGCMLYPALYKPVISVGATNQSDERAGFSSYGSSLDVVAPGAGTINSPVWVNDGSTNYYSGSLYGTSFSSPQVASLASLIRSIRPNSSVDDVRALIAASSSKPSTMNNELYTDELGHGMIDAGKSIQVASSLNATNSTPKLWQAGGAKNEHRFSASDSLGSGCHGMTSTYCTVSFADDSTGRYRYLPYAQINTNGQTGWTWNGSFLGAGTWETRAIQGDYRSSTPYLLKN